MYSSKVESLYNFTKNLPSNSALSSKSFVANSTFSPVTLAPEASVVNSISAPNFPSIETLYLAATSDILVTL